MAHNIFIQLKRPIGRMRELIDFAEDTVLVTGGASEIGSTIGTEFATEGANVVLSDIDDERGRAAVDEIGTTHDSVATYHHVDVSDLESCKLLVESVLDEFGSIDHLVNIAAVAHPATISKPFLEEGPEDWNKQVSVTLMGTVNMAYAVLPHMIDQDSGTVVNFASEAYKGQDRSLAMYGAAKSAVATFTRTTAKEFGKDGIRINAISPSATLTDGTEEFLEKHREAILEQHALPRLGEPEDHANAAVFLASDAADWITGQVLSVNGGYL
jgi:3-oxoacyl-[acyl-carrier protein] reductase